MSLQNGRLLGRSEFYSTAYTMQTGKVEFPKCCKYHYHVQDAANTIRYERFYLPHVANARQNERLYLQNDVPHYCSFCKCLLPCFFGLDGVVSFLSLRLYTALVASWLHRFVGVNRNHNHNHERKRNANTNTA